MRIHSVITALGITALLAAACSESSGGGSGGGSAGGHTTTSGGGGSSGDGGSGGGGMTVDTMNFCDDWVMQCPSHAGELAACKTNCEQNQMLTSEDCSFAACSVETGKCDNEEMGDPSILACIQEHGWF